MQLTKSKQGSIGRVPMQSTFGKRLLRPLTALTRHKQRLRRRVDTKSDAESKALTPSPFVYLISSHINIRLLKLELKYSKKN